MDDVPVVEVGHEGEARRGEDERSALPPEGPALTLAQVGPQQAAGLISLGCLSSFLTHVLTQSCLPNSLFLHF